MRSLICALCVTTAMVGCADLPDNQKRISELSAENARLRAENEQLRARLRAIKRPDAPEVSEEIAALRFRGLVRNSDGSNSIGDYTVTGPVTSSLRPIYNRITKLAIDSQFERVYARGGHEVYLLPDRGEPQLIAENPELERLSWLSAVAFDTKRNRLLASTFGGGGCLYSYEPDNNKWSIICQPGLGASALAYAESEDVLYGVNLAAGPKETVKTLMTFNQHGARTSEISLSEEIETGGDFGHTQLLWDNGWLFLVQSQFGHRRRDVRPHGYLIQPDTGEVHFSSELIPE